VSAVPPAWAGFVDDAAIFPPGDAPLPEAVTAYRERRDEWYADLVGPLVVRDTDLPDVDPEVPVSVVLTGGAGAVAGVASLAAKKGHRLVGIEAAVRDLDDIAGNVRRITTAVDAARDVGTLEDTAVYVELPQTEPTPDWLAAADAVAETEHHLKFRTGGVEARLFPPAATVAAWIDAALDRETAFKCTAGLHHAIRHRDHETGFEHLGFLNLLLATRVAFDGATVAETARVLDDQYANDLVAMARQSDLAGARRWFTSFGSCSVTDPLEDLVGLDLLEAPHE
jgi:cell division ATPase FtsA